MFDRRLGLIVLKYEKLTSLQQNSTTRNKQTKNFVQKIRLFADKTYMMNKQRISLVESQG